jgi:hypothetical protein
MSHTIWIIDLMLKTWMARLSLCFIRLGNHNARFKNLRAFYGATPGFVQYFSSDQSVSWRRKEAAKALSTPSFPPPQYAGSSGNSRPNSATKKRVAMARNRFRLHLLHPSMGICLSSIHSMKRRHCNPGLVLPCHIQLHWYESYACFCSYCARRPVKCSFVGCP